MLKPPGKACLLAALTIALALPFLGRAPIYLAHDEVLFALQARAIAATGHDLKGRFLPLYFELFGGYWAQPLLVYATALVLKVLPLSEAAIRLPSVLIGGLDVALMYLIARRIFRDDRLALAAGLLLALTPSHFFYSRLAVDPIYPVPFVLGWLLCLVHYFATNRIRFLFVGTFVLGVGVYSYIGSLVTMPVCLVVTSVAVLTSSRGRVTALMAALAGFLAAVLPFIAWVVTHPSAYADQSRRYGLGQLAGYTGATTRLAAYWDAFNPSFLFVFGDPALMNATHRSGVFLLPLLVLVPLGINHIVNVDRSRTNLVLLAGLLLSPLAVAAIASVNATRLLVMLPWGVLLATLGLRTLLSAGRAWPRTIAVGLLVLAPLQFAFFYADYFTAYRTRSAPWFDGNLRGVFEYAIAHQRVREAPAIYISRDINWMGEYWEFYLAKAGRDDLSDRTVGYEPTKLVVRDVPAGSLVITKPGERAPEEALARSGDLRLLTSILEPGGEASFSVYER